MRGNGSEMTGFFHLFQFLASSATMFPRINSTGESSMQYPPQQGPSMSQPQAPAEIIMPEQPQIYPPQPPVAAPEYLLPGPGQEIALYARRGPALFRAVLCIVTVLLLI